MTARDTAVDRNRWRDAVWTSDLRPMRRLAALCYADHAGETTSRVWVGTRRGMERTGMGRTAWHEARNDLESDGWLRETVPATHTDAARYALTIPKGGQCRQTDTPGGRTVPPDGQGVYRQTDRTPTETPTAAAPDSSQPDLAEQLAASQGKPLDACRQALATKRTELAARPGTRDPDAVLARIVATSPDELTPLIAAADQDQQQQAASAAARAELEQAAGMPAPEQGTTAWSYWSTFRAAHAHRDRNPEGYQEALDDLRAHAGEAATHAA